MPSYPVLCTQPGCCRPAVYKIAARWSDGATEELKTYALCCEECREEAFRRSLTRNATCRTARGETLEPPGVYVLARGRHDQELERRSDLENVEPR
jgi:hypothetical protein